MKEGFLPESSTLILEETNLPAVLQTLGLEAHELSLFNSQHMCYTEITPGQPKTNSPLSGAGVCDQEGWLHSPQFG